LIERLSKAGYKKLLLVSGEGINKLFFEASLIDEIHLTIEPYLFGSGKKITAAFSGFRNLKLLSCEQLNKNGTLLVRYKVIDKLNKSKLNRST
jgi:dihydrofolate reductase